MGSSPFTATTSPRPTESSPGDPTAPDDAIAALDAAVERAVDERADAERADAEPIDATGPRRWLVAFSGGPDSTALAWALARLRRRWRLAVTLGHVDHGLDSDSARRADAARALAERLGLPIELVRLDGAARPPGSSVEAWARERRYAALGAMADRVGAERIATAHHADDQAETLLLRLAYGSGLAGLAGIRPRRGRIVRPLLDLRRRQLLAALVAAGFSEGGLAVVDDPTNRDLARPRNRIRHRILPEWNEWRPRLVDELGQLARSAAVAVERLDRFFSAQLDVTRLPTGGSRLDRARLDALPHVMIPHALSTLERVAGRALTTPTSARRELVRQLAAGPRVGCDAGAGWRWHGDGRSLRLLPPRKPPARFTYTVDVPGSVSIAEIGSSLRISAAPAGRLEVADRATKAFLRPPLTACRRVEIRNRRPGDRLRPAGRRRERRLKHLLIDQRIPREERDRLPLVVVDGRLAWVPGVAVDERFGAEHGEPAWLVELDTPGLEPPGATTDPATA